jgi:hypothetical protein
MTELRQTSRGVIARHLNMISTSMEAHRFELSRTRLAIYHIRDRYWCSPPKSEGPPTEWNWQAVADIDGRPVYCATTPPQRFRQD